MIIYNMMMGYVDTSVKLELEKRKKKEEEEKEKRKLEKIKEAKKILEEVGQNN